MMTAEQLKASILQMAMQGKLVEQRAEEGTGEELYKKIIEERQQLVKSGRIKKDNVVEESTGEPPFDIPDSWHWATLNDIVSKTIKRGKSPKYVPNSGTLVFAQKCNTKAGYIDLSLCLYLDESKIDKYPEEEFMLDGDIVINSTGNGTLGRVGVYHSSDNSKHLPIVPDSHVTVIRCNKYMNLGFVLYCLRYYQPYMEKLGSGSTNQTELGAGLLKSLYFPIPPLEEQKRIVAKIEELIPFVEQYAKASTRLNTLNASFPEQMKKSILQQAVVGKLVPQDTSDEPASVLLKKIAEEKQKLIKEGKIKRDKNESSIIFQDSKWLEVRGNTTTDISDEISYELPNGWHWTRLREIGDWGSGATPSRSKPGYYGGNIPWLKTGDLTDGLITHIPETITEEALAETSVRLNPEGSVLIAMYGATIGKLGILTYPATTNQACCACLPLNGIYNRYLFYFLMAHKKVFIEQGAGGAQPNISKEKIVNTLMPIPPINEQYRIVSALDIILPLTADLKG